MLYYQYLKFIYWIAIVMASKKHKSSRASKNDSSVKGKLVEMIVAIMHDKPNIRVERNVRVPALRDPNRKREIDVLLTGSFSGYPVRLAIECKNYSSIIDVPKIDSYVGKLQDIGIATECGIYVSANGFSEGAVERAKEVGITLLILTGLTPDRLASKVFGAIQSVVYLLLEVADISILNYVDACSNSALLMNVFDNQKRFRATIPDLIWREWIEDRLPNKIGEYKIDVPLPRGSYHLINGMLEPIEAVTARIEIVGLSISLPGRASQHVLINAGDKTLNKFKLQASFDTPQDPLPITRVYSEEALREHIEQQTEKVKLAVGRYQLPRIYYNSLYWLLSERATKELEVLELRCQQEQREVQNEELQQIEGSNLKTVWEPIWEKNPILREI